MPRHQTCSTDIPDIPDSDRDRTVSTHYLTLASQYFNLVQKWGKSQGRAHGAIAILINGACIFILFLSYTDTLESVCTLLTLIVLCTERDRRLGYRGVGRGEGGGEGGGEKGGAIAPPPFQNLQS